MAAMFQILFGLLLAAGLFWRLAHVWVKRRDAMRKRDAALLDTIRMAMPDAADVSSGVAGVKTFAGTIDGEKFQIQTIVDTLATRKLPSWWLSVTAPGSLPLKGTLDLLVRPNTMASFSNYDLRPYSVAVPAGFPEHAGIRSDVDGSLLPLATIANHIEMMFDQNAKELLISPHGVRVVWLLAEGDRARYGVFRQADFGDHMPKPDLVLALARRVSALKQDLLISDLAPGLAATDDRPRKDTVK